LPNFLVRFSVSINLALPDCCADVNYRLVGAIEYSGFLLLLENI
jgi:hypothetical protein